MSSNIKKKQLDFRGTSSRKINVCVSTLNQWAMDFEGNKQRILESIKKAKELSCNLRTGPELEISGYTCEDHFLESDTILHSWEVIREIMTDENCKDIVLDLGAPIEWQGTLYNCRVFILNKKILLIRPKASLADDGNYREGRWFTGWQKGYKVFDFRLPLIIQEVTSQMYTKIGMAMLTFNDVTIANEICEELWDARNPSSDYCLNGAEIILNNSGSHFGLDKYKTRVDLMKNSCRKNGGAYIYSNLTGCDGGRLYFDGGSLAYINGFLVKEGEYYPFEEVSCFNVIIDLDDIAKYRSSSRSRCLSSNSVVYIDKVNVDQFICSSELSNCELIYNMHYEELRNSINDYININSKFNINSSSNLQNNKSIISRKNSNLDNKKLHNSNKELDYVNPGKKVTFLSPKKEINYKKSLLNINPLFASHITLNKTNVTGIHREIPEEEQIEKSTACWMWDYLRRSGASGFFLPLSGGSDSASVAIIISNLCKMLLIKINSNCSSVIKDLRRIVKDNNFSPKTDKEICKKIFSTAYLGTKFSSKETRSSAKDIAIEIGSNHYEIEIDDVYNAFKKSLFKNLNFEPKFITEGGCQTEDLALQNLQSRLRMVTTYLLAQLAPLMNFDSIEIENKNSSNNLINLNKLNLNENYKENDNENDSKVLQNKINNNITTATNNNNDNNYFNINNKKTSNNPGFLLVLASGNLDESLLGYLTKYDCSSGDLNPIGSLSKKKIKNFLFYCYKELNYKCLKTVLNLKPSAELRPYDANNKETYQTDEEDMGFTYEELEQMGKLRKVYMCGPYSMFKRLRKVWTNLEDEKIRDKVKRYFYKYSVNRHKVTTLTPSIFMDSACSDDNRFDQRQFLYNPNWDYQMVNINNNIIATKEIIYNEEDEKVVL